ncbi:MAG: sulfatase [Planctomycetes bacterium]|nr:sulfatase [Planctomycetota bacterium]
MSHDGLNILLITSEDNGLHLSCYGDRVVQTPNLDRLASEGAAFEEAYITQAVCSPSRASILTGLYPHQNGQIGLATHRFTMHESFQTIPSMLKGAGYRTGLIGKLHVLPESAFPFDMWWRDPERISFQHRDVKTTAEVAGRFMSESNDPFFLMVNYADAHLPWLRQEFGIPDKPFEADDVQVPPGVGVDTPRLRGRAADYYNCMSRLDTGFGMLMEELERSGHLEDTLIIYLADHGPQFSRGKAAAYELAVKVPFIVRWPDVPGQGRLPERLVSSIDIMPTILEAAGLEADEKLPGLSLMPLVFGQETEWRSHLFCEWNTSHPYPLPSLLYPQRTVRDGRYKLIRTLLTDQDNPVERYYTQQALVDTGASQSEIDGAAEDVRRAYASWRRPKPIELYDLQEDPHEFRDLSDSAQHAEIKQKLSGVLADWCRETGDPLTDSEKLARLVEEDRAVQKMEGEHRKPEFRWEYVDYLYG